MDPISLIYMGLVCGALAVWAPSMGKQRNRFIVGVAIGIIAIALLPWVRGIF